MRCLRKISFNSPLLQKKCTFAKKIIIMFDIEEIKDDLEILKEIILEKVPTDQIWLFGSYAYGTPNKNSDIDIYIVMKDDAQMRELDAMAEVHGERFYRKTKKTVDLLAIKRNRFDYRAENFSMERKIKREGVKIYG